MALQIDAVMLGVDDLARSKAFYEALGCALDQDYPGFVSFKIGGTSLALYGREAAAADAGVSPEGSGFRGVSFHHIVGSRDEVDEVMRAAGSAGARVVREATASPYGYDGYFGDPDGYLWKVATSA
jgi:uncharacterized protein